MSTVNAVAEMMAKVELILSRGARGTTTKRPLPTPIEIESSNFVPVQKAARNLRKGKCALEPTELVKSAAAVH